MLIYLYFVTSNFLDGLNWLFSCLPEGVKPLGENLIFPRLRLYIVINFKMGSFKLLSIKAYCWNSKLENQQAKKNLVSDWMRYPAFHLQAFLISPCERRSFLEASFQGSALGWCITCSWRISTGHPSGTQRPGCFQRGQGVPSPPLARQQRRLQSTGAEPGRAGAPKAKREARSEHPHGASGGEPAPFQPGRNSRHWWIQGLLRSLFLTHGVQNSLAPKGMSLIQSCSSLPTPRATAHTEHLQAGDPAPPSHCQKLTSN